MPCSRLSSDISRPPEPTPSELTKPSTLAASVPDGYTRLVVFSLKIPVMFSALIWRHCSGVSPLATYTKMSSPVSFFCSSAWSMPSMGASRAAASAGSSIRFWSAVTLRDSTVIASGAPSES